MCGPGLKAQKTDPVEPDDKLRARLEVKPQSPRKPRSPGQSALGLYAIRTLPDGCEQY